MSALRTPAGVLWQKPYSTTWPNNEWKADSAGVNAGEEYDCRAVEVEDTKLTKESEEYQRSQYCDLVVTVCEESPCVNIPHGGVVRWHIKDPKGKSKDEYPKTLSLIENKVKELLRRLENESS